MTKEHQELEEAKGQMRKGLLEFCTLLAISKDRMYSSDILEKLKNAEMLVVEGTLYPLLSRMRGEGLLEYEWAESSAGPPRKYYSLTAKGKAALEDLKITWKALHKSIESLLK
jgi:PadR family transcriptional regulator, regulatory protein PadR